MLFRLWTDQVHRPTRDLDLLSNGSSSVERVVDIFQDVCAMVVEDDGLTFDPRSVRGEQIKEDQDYEGVRLHCEARLGQPRISLQIDLGFGDAVTPKAIEVQFPVMLDFPAPVLAAYPRQTVVAEKFQAMVALGIANSRMKDFFDLWTLARAFDFDGPSLSRAIQATFRRRKTPLPTEPPLALTPEFATDGIKVRQWQAFLKKSKLDAANASLADVCTFLNQFLMPPTLALVAQGKFHHSWPPSGPWKSPA